MRRMSVVAVVGTLMFGFFTSPCVVAEVAEEPRMVSETFSGLKLRGIGPAFMSGRISQVAKDPSDSSVWYVAVSSGGVWKTVNTGTTWKPIFDHYGAYSIGSVAVDPKNPHVVWVGTGEGNSQRSVGWGDGIYKSLDGGESFTNMGLKTSEHIGQIAIDPRDSDIVWVAAQGSLWKAGGDRGLYKTIDGGETWERLLHISDNTGIADVVLDPRNPDVVYASSYQRRRRVWTLIAGGPESGIHKSTDGGRTWRKQSKGLPSVHLGRIGLAVSPIDPDVVYAIIAAEGDHSGFYRSSNLGETWVRMSDYSVVDPQYYQRIYPDPHRFDRVYSMDVIMHVTEDGGKTFSRVDNSARHVDNHCMLFDADNPNYLLVGGDGGLYESWDRGKTYRFIDNLPVTQFYRVAADNDLPFYNVYGGTQDNSTQGGPSRTLNRSGIRNSDWFITVGGDGYQTRIDPDDPNILYSMYQYGGLIRYDRRNGELVDIQPQPGVDDEPLVWNWDSPLLISPHSGSRLYFAADRLFRSDDRGDSWTAVSPDLTRNVNRDELPVMGRVWSVDAVWKNVFTSIYGNIVALDESTLVEGLIYVGTDDGLIQVTEDGGKNWRREESFPGVPEHTYVSDVLASRHEPDTVYALFNNHKSGDYEPYVLKSNDRGRTWKSIRAGLKSGHVAWSIEEDHERAGLLFLGTEFSLFLSSGGDWIQLDGDFPVVAVRDLQIQRRENDLIVGTFGRGMYILDDYSALRNVDEQVLGEEATLFPVKDPLMYIQSRPLGWGEKGTLGHGLYTALNPPFGAVFTYYLRDSLKSKKETRRGAEHKAAADGESVSIPGWDELREEDTEEAPSVQLVVEDSSGTVVRRLDADVAAGFHRVAWDLRWPTLGPVASTDEDDSGPMVAPGTFTVRLVRRVGGVAQPLSEPQAFEAVPLGIASLPAEDRQDLVNFHLVSADLQRAVLGTAAATRDAGERIATLKRTIQISPGSDEEMAAQIREIEARLNNLRTTLFGDQTVARRQHPTMPSIVDRVERVMEAHWSSTSAATKTHLRNYKIAATAFESLLAELRQLLEVDLTNLEGRLEKAGVNWTPGRRLPIWEPMPFAMKGGR